MQNQQLATSASQPLFTLALFLLACLLLLVAPLQLGSAGWVAIETSHWIGWVVLVLFTGLLGVIFGSALIFFGRWRSPGRLQADSPPPCVIRLAMGISHKPWLPAGSSVTSRQFAGQGGGSGQSWLAYLDNHPSSADGGEGDTANKTVFGRYIDWLERADLVGTPLSAGDYNFGVYSLQHMGEDDRAMQLLERARTQYPESAVLQKWQY